MPKSDVAKIKAEVSKERKGKPEPSLFLSTGSTLVNLAISGKVSGGFAAGCYFLLVGGSRSGKTFLVLDTLAQASISPKFDAYSLVLFAPERGARMNIKKFFGQRLADRLIWEYPESLDEFYFKADDYLKAGPCIIGLDSMDALRPEKDGEYFDKQKTQFRKGKSSDNDADKPKGNYGLQKAKDNSAKLREIHNRLEEHKSILVVISQTRKNIGPFAMFNPETRAGGEALTFYSTAELWFKVKQPIKKLVNKKQRKIGTVLQMKVKKNRDTGREPTVELLHFPSVGFDDTGSLVAWLIEEGHWKENKGLVTAGDMNLSGSREDVITAIEENDREKELRLIVAEQWAEIERACSVSRKARYS